MTLEEKVIVSAYTGYLMCDMSEVHKYVEELLGRPVWTHEMAIPEVQAKIQEKARQAFLDICNTKSEDKKIGFVCNEDLKAPIFDQYDIATDLRYYTCPYCRAKFSEISLDQQAQNGFDPHCPSCAKRFDMEGVRL